VVVEDDCLDDEDDVRELLNQTRESEPPDRLDYNEYLVATQGYKNKATIQHSAYPLLSKRMSLEARISGYVQNANYTWSEVDYSVDFFPADFF
jgi:hypothetical protein